MDLGIFDSLSTLPEVHNTLRRLICVEYLPIFPEECKRSFRIFKANSRIHLSIAQQSLDDPLEIFDALEKGGKIKLGEYRILKVIAKDADARIVTLIEAAEKRMEQIRDERINLLLTQITCPSRMQTICVGSKLAICVGTVIVVVVGIKMAKQTVYSSNHQSASVNQAVLTKDTTASAHVQDVFPGNSLYDINTSERRILIIGKTGVGKSETGNRILGKREFETDASDESVTSATSLGQALRDGKRLMVVDTPGLFDTKRTNEETISEIMKCYAITAPGLHAILLVLDIGRMTDEQINTINIFQERFGKENFDRFLMVVFTGKDKLTHSGKTIDSWVQGLNPESNLKKLLHSINNRYVALSFLGSPDDLNKEIDALLAMIERVYEENGGQYYTNEMYRQADKLLQDRLAEVKRNEKERHDREMAEAMEPLKAEHAQKERELQEQIEQKDKELEKRKNEDKDDFMDKVGAEWNRFKKRGYKIAW